jgi:hypothetical protein
VKRVLARGGSLRMLEHVRSTGKLGARIQDFIHPAWKLFAGGCNNNRDTESNVRAAGFQIDDASLRRNGTMRRFEAKPT